ncbi:MAG: tRNA lysidine(34) synthetase TilS [Sedimentisphaerales bacterium]
MLKLIEQKVLNFINLYNLLPDGAKVLLAVSGGADSVALLKILLNLKLSGKLTNDFYITHINHQLRGQKSIEDEEFVRTLAKQHNLPAAIERVDVKKYAKEQKLSIETAARCLRLEKLAAIAQKNGCSCIAAAHQKNDNAETIIHRLLRGTGFKGLAGIRPKTDFNDSTFIRPLLCISRNEIENYLKSQDINWQTDHTNIDCRFTRNRIRHRLLPYLQNQSADNVIESLFVLSQHCLILSEKIERNADAALKKCVIDKTEDFVSMDIEKFNPYPSFVKVEIIQNALHRCGIGLQKITNEHYDKILKFLMNGQKGKILQLPDKAVIKISNLKFQISNFKSQPSAEKPESVLLKIPGSVHFANWTIETEILPADRLDIRDIKKNKNNFIQWFDLDLIKPPLTIRCRQKGDRFMPFGHNASKKVSKFLTSTKLNLEQRKKAFIVCDSKKILWFVPVRRSKEAKIDISTRKILKIKVINQSF